DFGGIYAILDFGSHPARVGLTQALGLLERSALVAVEAKLTLERKEGTVNDKARDATHGHRATPYGLIAASFIVAALLASFAAEALDADHIIGLVPLGGLVGAALAEWLWRARRKA
ncbi:hypothetical protein, partial [Lysobacter sp. F60174L2]|uniref:hypothetical protein n=1 Tax=Lysobacter sp. F60174L2 TaxID=3459295 RepID=UPI00403DF94A